MRGAKGDFTVVCVGFLDSWCPRPVPLICGAATRRIVPRVIQLVEVILLCWNVSGSDRAVSRSCSSLCSDVFLQLSQRSARAQVVDCACTQLQVGIGFWFLVFAGGLELCSLPTLLRCWQPELGGRTWMENKIRNV